MTKLLTPFSLAGLTLKNRLIFPPLTTGLADAESGVSEEMIAYYHQRAKGVAVVIVEPGVVQSRGKLLPRSMGIWEERFLPGLKRLTDSIHEAGAHAFIQLAHGGAQGIAPFADPVAPSPVEFIKGHPARELTREEIARLIADFVAAARRARQAGFDGVEVHGAHLYLLSAFLSPLINRRSDEYGGSLENRARIVCEIIAAIKQELGKEFPVTVRFNAEERGGMAAKEGLALAKLLAKSGADALHASNYVVHAAYKDGIFLCPAISGPGTKDPEGMYFPWAKAIKAAVDLPVIGVGKIQTRAMAETFLEEGAADLVAVGRALVADPRWTQKVVEQSEKEPLRACLACNHCLMSLRQGPMTCAVNPDLTV